MNGSVARCQERAANHDLHARRTVASAKAAGTLKVLQIMGKTIQPGAVQLDDLRGWVGVRLFGCDLSDEERQENSKQRAGDHVTAIFSD